MSHYKIYIFITALLCSSGLLQAQEQDKQRGIQFSCMLWDGPLTEKIYYRDGDTFNHVVPFTGSRSLPHILEKSKEFALYVENKEAKEKELPYKLVGKAALLPGVKQILFILFLKQTEGELEIRILALDDSLNGFPAGTFRFANFSKSELLVKFAGATKKIPSREMTIMKSGVKKEGGVIPFLIGNEQGKKIFETRLFAQLNGREIVFIGPPKKEGGLPSVRFLPQLLW